MKLPRFGVRSRLLIAIFGAVALALVTRARRVLVPARAAALCERDVAREGAGRGRALVGLDPEREAGRAGGAERRAGRRPRLGLQRFSRARGPRTSRREVGQVARSLVGGPRALARHRRSHASVRAADRGERRAVRHHRLRRFPRPLRGDQRHRADRLGRARALDPACGQPCSRGGCSAVRSCPVSRMTADAAAWSEHDPDQRFHRGEPYDELTQLAATLDRLLERIAASLRHEQRFTAEISHELRTPLARISGEAELMLRRQRTTDEYREALAAIKRSAEQMTRHRRDARRRGTTGSRARGCDQRRQGRGPGCREQRSRRRPRASMFASRCRPSRSA